MELVKKKVAIIGSHGLYANYGGWDQLVKNLAEQKSENINYLIFNSSDSDTKRSAPSGVKVKKLWCKASGFQGLFYDFFSLLICYWNVDTILLLGVQGIPLIPILRLFRKVNIVSNVGGIEWQRPKFGFFSKIYLKFCFNLCFKFSSSVIIDNPHYYQYVPRKIKTKVIVIPYGGEIDSSLYPNAEIENRYAFLKRDYFLSISRSLEDNLIDQLCSSFIGSTHTLVMISNFSRSAYGINVLDKYNNNLNIILIDGLYIKPELDLIRRKCKAYIHTHTLCGTAPSLVEMIVARRPIISIDKPQNRFTLNNQAFFFSDFSEIQKLLNTQKDLEKFIPSNEICQLYNWGKIVLDYESLY